MLVGGLAAAGSGLAGVGGGRRAGAVLPARGGLRLGGPVSDHGRLLRSIQVETTEFLGGSHGTEREHL